MAGQGAPPLRQRPGPVGPLLVADPLSRVSLRLPSCMFLGGSGEDQGYRRKPFARFSENNGDALGAVYLVEGIIDYPLSCFSDELSR